ncbi:protein TraD [Legionella quinlivanii]|uniref:Protein TraD n=1 Tax=Legionella quinlivanii TaxID=45073 RepID=A0A0W0XTC5_9GAMM|nr:conjugal transfer protein TraD [Legionella quinlivanii]KTD47880.1 protein TraD [Legionella quinlivanii]SEG37445.1 Conjugal transfer protein TraD [Legionella quinlivanii DSM 21216]STY10126.1 protein TraD [Legionella quinlivanii]
MDITKQIAKQKQIICREEKSLMIDKIKQRRAETRRKIELGGVVIKSGMGDFNKSVILGSLNYAYEILISEAVYKELFEIKGEQLFLSKKIYSK